MSYLFYEPKHIENIETWTIQFASKCTVYAILIGSKNFFRIVNNLTCNVSSKYRINLILWFENSANII